MSQKVIGKLAAEKKGILFLDENGYGRASRFEEKRLRPDRILPILNTQ